MENVATTQSKPQWQQMGNEGKKAAVREEMKRMNQLPANSNYATHRLRVLNKVLQLLSTQDPLTGSGAGIAICWAASVILIVYPNQRLPVSPRIARFPSLLSQCQISVSSESVI